MHPVVDQLAFLSPGVPSAPALAPAAPASCAALSGSRHRSRRPRSAGQVSAKLGAPLPPLPPSSPDYNPAALLAQARAALRTAPSASTFLTLAERERRSGNFPAVRAALSSATTLEPNNSHLWRYWADFQLETDSPSSARAIYKLALSSSKTPSAFLLYPFAQLEIKLGECASARKLLYQAIALSPDEPEPYITLASLESRDSARAILEYAATRLGSTPEASAVYTARARLEARDRFQVDNGDETARSYFRKARDADPSVPSVWQTWAVFESRRDRHTRARELLERGMLVDSQNSALWAAWGTVEAGAGAHETARNLFARAIEIDRQNAFAWASWGNMERKLGNDDKARIVFWKAAESLQPGARGLGSIYAGWAAVEVLRNDIPQARALFDKSIKAEDCPKAQARHFFARADMEKRQGSFNVAERMYRNSLRCNSRDHITLHCLGKLHVQMQQYGEARKWFARAERICPADIRVLCEWAQLEYQYFEHEEGVKTARSLYSRARNIDSKNSASDETKLYSSAAAFERAHGSNAQARIYSQLASARRKTN